MNVEAVIGANYGDEGKGLFTDYLCVNRPNPVVVMSNGGSQRGHTVVLEDGTRHVFHHFGSGTLRDVPTYFPKQYLLNPMQFANEYEELEKMGHTPKSFRHPDCIIQLPCDIALNWHIERARGEKKHGSAGCGIWETKYRMYHNDAWTLKKFVMSDYATQVYYIKDQAKRYRDKRCGEECLTNHTDIYDLFMSKGLIDHFISDCFFMFEKCIETDIKHLIEFECRDTRTLIFENGQGLKLDQLYGGSDEANTTPSFTGSIGVAQILNEENLNIENVSLNYVSRTYLTKHGVGKFAEEDSELTQFEDKTNVWNEWQEGLRFGKLDYNELYQRCDRDILMFNKFLDYDANLKKNVVMTHSNEIPIPEKQLKNINFISKNGFSRDIREVK